MITPTSLYTILLYLVLSLILILRLEYLLPSHYLDYKFSTISAVLQLNQMLCVIVVCVMFIGHCLLILFDAMFIGHCLLILFSVSCLPTCQLYLDG